MTVMMGIGFWEMMLLAGIALVIIGPEKFPDFAKVVVRTIRDLRGYMDEVKKELSDELKPVEREMRSLTQAGTQSYNQIRSTIENPASRPATEAASSSIAPDGESSDAASNEETGQEASPVADTEPYGKYEPESDQDYDHTAPEDDGAMEGDDMKDREIGDVRPPERLDG